MSNEAEQRMTRWRDRAPGTNLVEDRAATLVREAPPPAEPDEAVLARVERRLLRPVPPRPRRERWVLRVALALVALVAGGASVKAFEWVRQSSGLWPNPSPAPDPSLRVGKQRAPLGRQVIPAAPAPEALTAPAPAATALPSTSPGPARLDERPSVSRPRRASAADAFAAGPPAAPALAPRAVGPAPSRAFTGPAASGTPSAPSANDEIAALDRAMALLRREHDAAAALVALDAYLHRYPNGFLQREALAGRIDALLVLGREAQALRALDGFPFDQHRRSTELRVIRAELRARGDCARAIADFGEAMAGGPDAALLARILYGRGTCRAKTGDLAGATADLGRYVERFPDGEHAAAARRWLAGSQAHEATGTTEER